MRAAIYIRVSTEEQAKEGYSISAQKQKLKAFCISQNWDVAGLYLDEGISAKDLKRPGLKRMIKDIEINKVDCVLVYRLDRLTRSVFDLYKLLDSFEKYDCKFKSATEVYDTTTAMGRMFITIVAALAQWERENMGERIAFGYEEKVRQGKCPFNTAPIGYDLINDKLEINTVEAVTIKIIFDKYLSGMGSNRLVRYLNKNNILTKRGNLWSNDTLLKVLKSPVHAGGIRWNDKIYWNFHDKIINKSDWDEVQRQIEVRKHISPRAVSSTHIFSGLLKCPGCGQKLTGSSTTHKLKTGEVTYKYYVCANSKDGKCEFKKSVSEKPVQKAFLQFLSAIDFTEQANEVATLGLQEQPKIDVNKLEDEITKLDKLKKKWQYAWAEDLIDESDFKKRMDEVSKKEQILKEQLEDKKTKVEGIINVEEIERELLKIKSNWNDMTELEKKNLLRDNISAIHVNRIERTTFISDIEFI